jgi:hypothetical protein
MMPLIGTSNAWVRAEPPDMTVDIRNVIIIIEDNNTKPHVRIVRRWLVVNIVFPFFLFLINQYSSGFVG